MIDRNGIPRSGAASNPKGMIPVGTVPRLTSSSLIGSASVSVLADETKNALHLLLNEVVGLGQFASGFLLGLSLSSSFCEPDRRYRPFAIPFSLGFGFTMPSLPLSKPARTA